MQAKKKNPNRLMVDEATNDEVVVNSTFGSFGEDSEGESPNAKGSSKRLVLPPIKISPGIFYSLNLDIFHTQIFYTAQ